MTIDIARVELAATDWDALTRRSATPDPSVVADAARIVAEVAAHGDAALTRFGADFGGSLASGRILMERADVRGAARVIDPEIRAALVAAIANVEAVHRPQRPTDTEVVPIEGIRVERVWSPVSGVGVYVPGGRGRYPSSLIMGVVPARIAGVDHVAVATPAAPDGTVDPVVLAAADLLEVDRIYAMGGAQAIGALAHGTETVRRVDTIVGPGGPWVTAAKVAVMGVCAIDVPAGPSEAVVLCDATADPRIVAADVMCQAEHGEESAIAFVTTDAAIADAVVDEIERALPSLDRADIIRTALADHGLIAIATDEAEAAAFADAWAPEHLSIHTADARSTAASIPSAGSVFVGHWTPEAAGDYATGANHVLPTGGLARAYGPLSVEDFGSWRQVQTATRAGLESLAPTIVALAEAEGFTAHARSVSVRLEEAS